MDYEVTDLACKTLYIAQQTQKNIYTFTDGEAKVSINKRLNANLNLALCLVNDLRNELHGVGVTRLRDNAGVCCVLKLVD